MNVFLVHTTLDPPTLMQCVAIMLSLGGSCNFLNNPDIRPDAESTFSCVDTLESCLGTGNKMHFVQD